MKAARLMNNVSVAIANTDGAPSAQVQLEFMTANACATRQSETDARRNAVLVKRSEAAAAHA